MKIAGFSFIKNAEKYDYPIVEAITSILPICDAFFIAVGNSDDNTLELIKKIGSDKIIIIETVWDESLRIGGQVLAEETNKAFDVISEDYDWCFYIQGDEVVHEKFLPIIVQSMKQNINNKSVEGLLFHYLHFYGSYDYIATSRSWYRHEVRIIRNDKNIRSYKDAMGFRKNGNKLNVKLIDAYIYHYGWVKDPVKQQEKLKNFNKLWHDDSKVREISGDRIEFDYSIIDSLEAFEGEHPSVMKPRIQNKNWKFSYDLSYKKAGILRKLSELFERVTGIRVGEYKNYHKI